MKPPWAMSCPFTMALGDGHPHDCVVDLDDVRHHAEPAGGVVLVPHPTHVREGVAHAAPSQAATATNRGAHGSTLGRDVTTQV